MDNLFESIDEKLERILSITNEDLTIKIIYEIKKDIASYKEKIEKEMTELWELVDEE